MNEVEDGTKAGVDRKAQHARDDKPLERDKRESPAWTERQREHFTQQRGCKLTMLRTGSGVTRGS